MSEGIRRRSNLGDLLPADVAEAEMLMPSLNDRVVASQLEVRVEVEEVAS